MANDLYAPFDADYDQALPQRHQDIDQAKSLLKAAGKEDLTVDLHTTDGAAGMVDSANVFASQAKAAGVTINVKNDPNYYGDQYLKLAFSVDFWGTRSYLTRCSRARCRPRRTTRHTGRPSPGTDRTSATSTSRHWPRRTTTKRTSIEHQMQKIRVRPRWLHHPVLQQPDRRHSTKVKGLTPSKGTLNLTGSGTGSAPSGSLA